MPGHGFLPDPVHSVPVWPDHGLDRHTGVIDAVVFNPDRRNLATGSADRSVCRSVSMAVEPSLSRQRVTHSRAAGCCTSVCVDSPKVPLRVAECCSRNRWIVANAAVRSSAELTSTQEWVGTVASRELMSALPRSRRPRCGLRTARVRADAARSMRDMLHSRDRWHGMGSTGCSWRPPVRVSARSSCFRWYSRNGWTGRRGISQSDRK